MLVCKRFVGSTVVGSPVSDHEDAVTVHGQAGKHIIDIFFIGNTFLKLLGVMEAHILLGLLNALSLMVDYIY